MAFESRRTVVDRGPSTGESLRRVTALIFAIIQGLIGLRILLLLLDARRDNALVRLIVDLSQVFVAPFVGVLHQNVYNLGGPQLDVAAVLALIGWSILEWVVLAFLAIFHSGHRTETIRTHGDLPEPGSRTTDVVRTEVRTGAPVYDQRPMVPPAPPSYDPAPTAPPAPRSYDPAPTGPAAAPLYDPAPTAAAAPPSYERTTYERTGPPEPPPDA